MNEKIRVAMDETYGVALFSEKKRLELLILLQKKPQMRQRDLAQAMGVSLGKANYCLKALVEKGLVKLENFRQNPNKRQYAYLLTSVGMEEKTRITLSFLRHKIAEYESLKREIKQLRGELSTRRLNTLMVANRDAEKQ